MEGRLVNAFIEGLAGYERRDGGKFDAILKYPTQLGRLVDSATLTKVLFFEQ
jgi:hypothetical protein